MSWSRESVIGVMWSLLALVGKVDGRWQMGRDGEGRSGEEACFEREGVILDCLLSLRTGSRLNRNQVQTGKRPR